MFPLKFRRTKVTSRSHTGSIVWYDLFLMPKILAFSVYDRDLTDMNKVGVIKKL